MWPPAPPDVQGGNRSLVRRLLYFSFLLILGIAGAPDARASTPGPDAIGIGSHPLTPVCASAWFVAHVDSSERRLILMTYILGPPGWVQEGSNFAGNLAKHPAEFSVVCGDVPVRLTYDPAERRATIQGRSYELGHDNVFVISAADRAPASVRSLGLHELVFAADDNPSIELVARDSGVREALVGRRPPAPKPAPVPARVAHSPGASPHALALYAEGRRWSDSPDAAGMARACSLFAQAAELGVTEAEYDYGYCLQSGHGRPQDLVEANDWYRKAAAHGSLNAAFKLGWSSRLGRGAVKDPAAALGWFRQCAVAGDSVCQALVGQMFELGEGTPARLDSAMVWYGRSAERGVGDAQYAVARITADQDSIGADPTAAVLWIQVLEAKRSQLPPAWAEELARWRPRLEQRLSPDARARIAAQANSWLIEDSKQMLERLAR